MTTYLIIETILLTALMGGFIYLIIKWVAQKPNLLQEINPKTGNSGPPHICRGGWREARLRGCNHGYSSTGIPVEPVNTYSNLAYFAAGWIAFRLVSDKASIIFCVTMAFLCFGSAIYHAIKTKWSARWDHGGMYAVFGGLSFYMMVAGNPWDIWYMLGGAIVCGVLLAWLLDGNLIARMGILLALILVGVWTRGNIALGWYSLGFFVLAMIIWLIDKKSNMFGKYGHGLWHILTAAALAILFSAI